MDSCIYNTNGFCYLEQQTCPYVGEEENCEKAEES